MQARPSNLKNAKEYNLLNVAHKRDVSSHLVHLQNRIAGLTDYRVYGSAYEDDLIHLYSESLLESNEEIVSCGAFDHTMFTSIDRYCSQKFPVDSIKKSLLSGRKFEIHGIFPSHFMKIAHRLGYSELEEIVFTHNVRTKKFNYVRPKFFKGVNEDGQRVFIVAVNSGRDYVFHYASMLRHIMGTYSVQMAETLAVYRYPLAESSIHIWTELNADLVKKGDLVIIGYVEEMRSQLEGKLNLERIHEIDMPYYTSIRYRNSKGTIINLIGVKYSFWGCISAKLVTQICRLGAKEIIYVGKLGALSTPNDLYSRIFIPSRFMIMYHDKVVCDIQSLKNGLLDRFPELSTGRHVSVPTVVEEDYAQRAITHDLDINSIDNEVSQIAYAVAQFNRQLNEDVSYTAIHFATDYIRRPHERSLKVKFDLSNNRTSRAFNKKLAILGAISDRLAEYLESK